MLRIYLSNPALPSDATARCTFIPSSCLYDWHVEVIPHKRRWRERKREREREREEEEENNNKRGRGERYRRR